MVPEGMRAITLEVNEFSGVAGLLTPGSHVDLVQTIQSKDDKAGPMAKTLVENLKVIAVGRRLGNPPAANGDVDPPMVRSVTLLATTEQAVTIDLASHVGSPRLVLRNTMDDKHNDAKGVTVAELRGADESASDNKLTDMMAQLLLSGPTTKPVETNVEPVVKPVVKNYREVEVIRAGASSNVRVTVSRNNEAISTTADKLLEDDSED
jgi:Flp pilus assembly protein CpaB